MNRLAHVWMCILAAPGVLFASFLLESWMLSPRDQVELGNPSWIWRGFICRALLVVLLFAVSRLMLVRNPNRAVAVGYFLFGTFVALAMPLSMTGPSALGRFLNSIPLMEFRGELIYFAAPALAVIGAVALFRHSVAAKSSNE
jgi:hypothetical protein